MKKHCFLFLFFIVTTIAFSQSFQWGKRGGSSDFLNNGSTDNREEEARCIVTDSQKNIYVLSNVGTLNLNFDGFSDSGYADPITKTDIALVSFSCEGNFRWSKIIGGGGFEKFQNLVIDDQDNLYLAGMFGDVGDIPYNQHLDDDVSFAPPADNRTLTVLKYNSSGVLQWYKRPQPSNFSIIQSLSCAARGLQIDSNGNLHWLVYLTPATYADGAFVKPNDGQFWYVLQYDGSGNYLSATPLQFESPGAIGWIQFFRNPYNGRYFLTARAVDENPNWAYIGGEPVTHSTFLACFNPDGQARWKRENASTMVGTVQFYNLVFDTDNNIYLGGRFFGLGTDTFMGLTIPEVIIPAFLMKIDAEASTPPIWETHHNKGANGFGALALNGNELGFTNFCTSTDFAWGSQTLNAGVTNELPEVLFARFDRMTGACIDLKKTQGNFGYTDYGSALAVDASGDYILGGSFSGTLTFDGGAQISSVGGTSDFFVSKYATTPCSPLTVTDPVGRPAIRLSPNPANTSIALNVEKNTSFEIVNPEGKKFQSGNIDAAHNLIEIGNLPSGFYFLNLSGDGDLQTLKFVKY